MENNNLPEGLYQMNDYPFPPEACLAGNMYMHNLYLWVKQHPPQKLKQGIAKLKELPHLAATASWGSSNMVEGIVECGINTLDTRNATTHWPISNTHSQFFSSVHSPLKLLLLAQNNVPYINESRFCLKCGLVAEFLFRHRKPEIGRRKKPDNQYGDYPEEGGGNHTRCIGQQEERTRHIQQCCKTQRAFPVLEE